VTLRKQRSGVCADCGERRRRVVKVTHTINPFNRDERGVPKSGERVLADVREKLLAEMAEPFRCARCETERAHRRWLGEQEPDADADADEETTHA
jgi:hypothetical protein